MEQWCDSDWTVMHSIWAILSDLQGSDMSFFIFWSFAMPWAMFGDTRPFDKNSDQTVMRQWCTSDETVMEQWCLWFESFSRICDVIDHILSFCNAFEVWLCICWLHNTCCQKQCSNSDGTVMQQWCHNSDATVIQQSCLWFELFFVPLI
jgi:hypothetical protein